MSEYQPLLEEKKSDGDMARQVERKNHRFPDLIVFSVYILLQFSAIFLLSNMEEQRVLTCRLLEK